MNRQSTKTLFVSLLLVFASATTWAQGTLKGTVKDSVENEILYGAEIRINDQEGNFVTGGSTDFIDGVYKIEVQAGTYQMIVSYMGYSASKRSVSIKDGETKEININLAEEVNVLKTVTKTASRFETPVGKTTISLDVVQPSLVENTNATKVDEVVEKVPGVSVVDGQANIRGGSGFSYGAGSRVLLLVDDLPLLSGDAGRPSWRDIPVENIAQIEVVKGAASALYGSSALNGIINIRTAYAKNKPYTKVSLFQTSFLKPKREELVWWNDPIEVWDAADNDPDAQDTITPAFFSGRNGYRKPIEFGIQAAHRRKIGKFDLTAGLNYFYSDSYRAGEYEKKFRANVKGRYRVTTKTNFGANVNVNFGNTSSFFLWNNSNKYLNGLTGKLDTNQVYIPLPGTITETVATLFNIDPFFTHYDKKEGRHRIQGRYYYINYENNNNQSNASQVGYLEYQYQRKFKIESAFFTDFKLVTGGVGSYTYSTSQLYGNADYNTFTGALYVQGEQGLFKEKGSDNAKLNITFGVRWELMEIMSPDSIQVDARNPGKIKNAEPSFIAANGVPRPRFRLGLNYEATPFTFIRASWGEGYRYPTIAERYITTQVGSGLNSLTILANPELKAETGWSAEIGIKQGFKIGKWKGFADLSGFWTEYQNMMEFTFGGGDPSTTNLSNIFFQSINIDDTRIRGFEFSVMGSGKFGPVRMNMLAGYTYIDPQFKNWETDSIIRQLSSADYNVLKYRNRHSVKFDVEALFFNDAFSVGFSINYNSRMNNIDNAFQDIIYNDPAVPATTGQDDLFGIGYYRENINSGEVIMMNARISYRYSVKNSADKEIMGIKLSVVGKNLLNQEYMIRPALVDAPTNITVRLDVDF